MIASGYSIDLYCDAPMHPPGDGCDAQFVDEQPRVAWKFARDAGWKVRIAADLALCPACVKAGAKFPNEHAFTITSHVGIEEEK